MSANSQTLAAIEEVSKMGVEVFMVLDDLSMETGPIMSIDHYREFIRPYTEELVKAAKSRDMLVPFHSDGKMWRFLDDLVEIGVDAFHPIQPQCMDISEVKADYGSRLCLVGNIDCRHLLEEGTTEEVEAAVARAIQVASPGGGYVLSSSNSIHPAVRPENLVAMVEAARKHGVYSVPG